MPYAEIVEQENRKEILTKLKQMCNIPLLDALFVMPVSLDKKTTMELGENIDQYVWSHKFDGIRVLLVLMVVGDEDNLAVLIDRSSRIYEVQVHSIQEYFDNGCVFDCELCGIDSQKLFVFDVYKISDIDLSTKVYVDRIVLIQEVFNIPDHKTIQLDNIDMDESQQSIVTEGRKIIMGKNLCTLDVQAKPIYHIRTLESKYKTESTIKFDGIIFTKNVPLAHQKIFKWKNILDNTVDIEILSSKLHCRLKGKCVELTKIKVDRKEFIFNLSHGISDGLYECNICIRPDIINVMPLKRRFDKQYANTYKTIKNTLQGCIDNIELQELIHISRNCT